jgi:hypothetical protein
MNNTTTKRNLSLVAIFMAATLVVGTFAVTTTTTIATTQTAFAFSKNKKGDENSRNGNTITLEKCQNKGSASGFDTAVDQECENLICTHPGENNATCVQEGAAVAAVQQGSQTTTPVKLTCEECFRKFLSADQLSRLLELLVGFGVNSLPDLCAQLSSGSNPELAAFVHEFVLRSPGLIQCLMDAGIVFPPVRG